MSRGTGRRFRRIAPSIWSTSAGMGALALLVGAMALAVPPNPFGERPTWEGLLAPYSTGALLPAGFHVHEIRRGPDNGIVISARRADDGATVEVLVVERGRWKSRYESRSFTIDYEVPRSPAVERDVITAFLAETIRSRDHGLPAPDAVPLRADDAGILPWWLERLRGVRGMLLGASFVVLALLAVVQSPRLAGIAVALGAIDLIARILGVPSLRPDVGAMWIVPAAGALLCTALWGRRSRSLTGSWLALAVAAAALVLRLGLGPWGPLHVNGHGARFVAGAVRDPADIAAYGPGYHEIFGPIAALASSDADWAIFACNALFSALVPALAFAIGRLVGLAPSAAVVAAALLAIDPVAIRAAATEAYFWPITFFCTAASVLVLVAFRESEAGERSRAAMLLLAAGLLMAQAARIHPCAWVLTATVPCILFAADGGSPRRRLLMAAAAAAVGGGIVAFTSATAVLDVLGNIRTGTVFRPPPPSPWPVVWIALPAAAYVLLAPRPWLALPASIALAAALLTRHAFDASWIWEQAYFRLYLTLPAIAALACVPPRWLRRIWLVGPAATVVVLAWMRFGWPVVAARSPEQLEYRWVRDQITRLPPECRVVHLASAGKRYLMLPTYAGPSRPAVAMDRRQPRTVETALAPAPCLYYVHGSLCSTSDGRPECDAIERRLVLAPIARAAFPSARERETFAHDGDVVETWIARVERVDGG